MSIDHGLVGKRRSLPLVGAGPGSHTDDEALDYLVMPRDMNVYRAPLLPDPVELVERTPVSTLLRAVRAALLEAAAGGSPAAIALDTLSDAGRTLLDQVLGEGEVCAFVRESDAAEASVEVQETVFTGVWRVVERGLGGAIVRDDIEVAPLPASLLQHTRRDASAAAALASAPGLMNAPAVLAELQERWRQHVSGASHVINLTLLPLSEADVSLLDATLGAGSVTILSRGYGNCRIRSSCQPHTWRVTYYNSQDTPILSTIEVCDVPEVACAARQDLIDSEARLAELSAFLEAP